MIDKVDVIFGAAWGDEGKGKICYRIAKDYDFVCRFNGGPNAGHTAWHNDQKIITHIVPMGIIFGKKCVIGPNCLINLEKFVEELNYLESLGFDTSLVKVSPAANIITEEHVKSDQHFKAVLGTTGQGIGPCMADKVSRTGLRAESVLPEKYLWKDKLYGKVLCEGAQSYWLDINRGEYPFVTSSECLPYSACSVGFSPKKIDRIIAVAKMYDTRSGFDSYFGMASDMSPEMLKLAELGGEFGSTTGRARTCKYLNLDRLVEACDNAGATELILTKGDVLEKFGVFKMTYEGTLCEYDNLEAMCKMIEMVVSEELDIPVGFDFER